MSETLRIAIEEDPTTQQLIGMAFSSITERYGPLGNNPKPYHNLEHTQTVVEAASLLADSAIFKEKIQPEDKRLIIIAAAYHDFEQDLGSWENEYASGQMAMMEMHDFREFTKEEIDIVNDLIMSTVVRNDGQGRMAQSATDDYRTKIVADADLSNLGKPIRDYIRSVKRLFEELHPNEATRGKAAKEFILKQVVFIKSHQFYTPEAEILFPHKQANIKEIESCIS